MSASQYADLGRAVGYLLASRVAFGRRATKAILDDLGRPVDRRPASGRHRALDPARVAWAVRTAARYLPWRSDCLIQAMAAAAWLRREGFAPDFHLGVARQGDRPLEAHAWLTLDGRVIVGDGAGPLDQFAPILVSPATDPASTLAGNDTMPNSGDREFYALVAICLGGPASASRIDAARVDWKRSRSLAIRHRVEGLLWQAIDAGVGGAATRKEDLTCQHHVPEPVRSALADARRRQAMTWLGQLGETRRLADRLGAAGCPVLVLKGGALAQQLYAPQPEARQSIDIDLLVAPGSFAAADRLLRQDGYRRTTPEGEMPQSADSMARYLLCAFEYLHPVTGFKVELHHRPLSDPRLCRVSFDELLARSVEVAAGTGRVRGLGGADLTVYLCCHAAGHAFFRLKWLADIARVVDRMGPGEIDAVLAHARALGSERPVLLSLVVLDRLTGRRTAPAGAATQLAGLVRHSLSAMRRHVANSTRYQVADIPNDLRDMVYEVRLAATWRSRAFRLVLHLVNHKDLGTLRLGSDWVLLYALLGRPLALCRWIGRGLSSGRSAHARP